MGWPALVVAILMFGIWIDTLAMPWVDRKLDERYARRCADLEEVARGDRSR